MLVPILGLAFGQTLRSEEMAAWGSDRHPLVAATCLRKMKIKNQYHRWQIPTRADGARCLGPTWSRGERGCLPRERFERLFAGNKNLCMMSDCQVEEGDLLAFYGGVQVQHTNYASDYKIRLSDDTDIDIPQVDG